MLKQAQLAMLGTWLVLSAGCSSKDSNNDATQDTGSGGSAGSGSGGASTGAGGAAGSGGGNGAPGSGGGNGASGSGGGAPMNPQGTPTPSGGTLYNGHCSPGGSDPTRENLGDKVKVFAMSDSIFSGPAADESGIYYSIDDDGLYRIVPGSDQPEQLIATPGKRYAPWINGDYLYYRISEYTGATSTEIVERLPLSDLKAEPTAVVMDPPRDWTVDETHVYRHDPDAHELFREPLGGGTKETLLSEVSVEFLVVKDDLLYFILYTGADDMVYRIPIAGGAMEPIVNAGAFDMGSYLLTDAGVYWNDFYGTFYTPFGKPTERTPVFGKDTYIIKVTDDRLYWTHDSFPSGSVGWTKIDQSDCKLLLDGGNAFQNAAIGSDGVYVTTFTTGNELFRVPLD